MPQHHYVPQCYLSAFAVQRRKARQVQVFDRTDSVSFQSSIRNVGGERNFNRIEVEGRHPEDFERGMAQFESELAPALRRVTQKQSLSDPDDKNYVLNLIALMAARNPSGREVMRDFHERTTKAILSVATSSREVWESQVRQMKASGYLGADQSADYEDARKAVENWHHYRVEVPTERHLIYEVEGMDAILPYLGRRGWMLVKAPANSGGFVTCDEPVALVWSDPPSGRPRRPPGFGLLNTEVFFPVSPRLAMMGSFNFEEDREHTASDRLVAEMNGATIDFARRQVYARDLHFQYTTKPGGDILPAHKLARDPTFRKT
jgi:Protein of unknown function (DUF4238)